MELLGRKRVLAQEVDEQNQSRDENERTCNYHGRCCIEQQREKEASRHQQGNVISAHEFLEVGDHCHGCASDQSRKQGNEYPFQRWAYGHVYTLP